VKQTGNKTEKQKSVYNCSPSQSQYFVEPPFAAIATTMLHCGDGILGVMRGVGFAPDIAFT
jgi:hypothetical protein